MQIKEMPAGERPQEKLLYYGASALSNTELLALIIRSGNRRSSALRLAEDVIAYSVDNCGGLENATASELQKIEGIGASKACSIVAGLELARRLADKGLDHKPHIRTSEDVVSLVENTLENEKREHLIELILNVKGEVESKITISIGELSSAMIGPREVLSPAIKRGAAGIILIHNHPSGNPEPSVDDIDATTRILEAGKIIGIRLLDHVVIGGKGKYVSLRERGLIND